MEAEEVLNLFDSYWFELEIFKTLKVDYNVEKPKISTPKIRSRSFGSYPFSSKLRKIPSEKVLVYNLSFETREELIESPTKKKKPVTRRNRIRGSKSLSELEFEELKGFTDLGFVFSEEDMDSELVSVVPGLHRLGKKGVEEMKTQDIISRPYLSEAWGVLDKKMVNGNLIDWQIQALRDRTNMKEHLKVWAQTVASTVRF